MGKIARLLLLFGVCLPALADMPQIDAVVPASGAPDAATEVVAHGRGFAPDGRAALLGGGPFELDSVPMPGGGNGVFCVGDKIYTSFYNPGTKLGGFTVVDASDPADLREVGRFELGDTSASIQVVGNVAYVPFLNPYTFIGGMHLVDVSDPAQPVRIESYFTLLNPQGLDVQGSTVYVADVTTVQIIDARDPAAPVKLGDFPAADAAWDVAVRDGLAYVADGGAGLQIYDVGDPAAARHLGSYASAASFALGVALAGDTAFVADAQLGLLVIDVSNPAAPALRRIMPTANTATDVEITDGRAYVTDGVSGVQIFDVGEPDRPRWIGGYAPRGSSNFFFDLEVVGDRLYVADLFNGLRALDVSTPHSLPLPASAAGDAELLAIAGDGDLLAAAQGVAGVALFSRRPDGGLARRGTAAEAVDARDVALDGLLLAVADGARGLRLFDVADADAPLALGGSDTSGTAEGVALAGGKAFVADGRRGLQIFDLSDPAAPVRLGGYDTRGTARGVHVADGIAYVADDSRGLQIIDVGDPTAPTLLATRDTPGRAEDVVVRDGVAWVADANRGLQSIDVSDPSDPRTIAGYTTDGRANDLAFAGSRLLVADGLQGLQIFDVADPMAPRRSGHFETPGDSRGVWVVADEAFVADGPAGVHRLPLNPPLEQPRLPTADRLPFVVPAGMHGGTYHLQLDSALAGTATAPNAFRICAARAFGASLKPLQQPTADRLEHQSLRWRLLTGGDPALAGHAGASLLLPGRGPESERRTQPPLRPARRSIEWHVGLPGGDVVRLIAADTDALGEFWDRLRAGGAIPLDGDPGDPAAFGPLRLAVRPGGDPAAAGIAPLTFDLNGTRIHVRAPLVLRYDFEGERLLRARLFGGLGDDPLTTDLRFAATANDGGCPYRAETGYVEALDALCRQLSPDPALCPPAAAGLPRVRGKLSPLRPRPGHGP